MPFDVLAIPRSVPAQQGDAILARLRDDDVLRGYFGVTGIKLTYSEAASEVSSAPPELWLWLEGVEEERLPSGVSDVTTHWRMRFVLPAPASAESPDVWLRTDLIDHAKHVVSVGDLRDDDSLLVADYLARWERIDAARISPDNATLRSSVGFAFTAQLDGTREYDL